MRVGTVTVAHGRHEHLRRQQRSLAEGSRVPDEVVVVAMEDPALALLDRPTVVELPADPARLPLAAARNAGARAAFDLGCDVLVFLDVDCLVDAHLVGAYAEVVRDEPRTVWSGPVTYLDPPPAAGYDLSALAHLDSPHPARPAPAVGERETGADPDLFWSLSFACSADAWQRIGGFCEDYIGYGGEDTDYARLIVDAGLDLGWVGAARAFHQWHPVSRPPVEHVHDIVRNAEIYRGRWGATPMLGWLEAFEERALVRRDDEGRWLAAG